MFSHSNTAWRVFIGVALLGVVSLLLSEVKTRVIVVVGKSHQRLCFAQVIRIEVAAGVVTITTPEGPAVFSLNDFFIVSLGEATAEEGNAFCIDIAGPRIPATQDLTT